MDIWDVTWRTTVAEARAAHGDRLPVVLMGTDARVGAAAVRAVDAAGFLAEPFELDELDALVRTACGPSVAV